VHRHFNLTYKEGEPARVPGPVEVSFDPGEGLACRGSGHAETSHAVETRVYNRLCRFFICCMMRVRKEGKYTTWVLTGSRFTSSPTHTDHGSGVTALLPCFFAGISNPNTQPFPETTPSSRQKRTRRLVICSAKIVRLPKNIKRAGLLLTALLGIEANPRLAFPPLVQQADWDVFCYTWSD